MERTNFLVPKHRKISQEEIQALLEKYNINSVEKLPKIKLKDPAIVELDVEVGDVVEVIRDKSFVGEAKFYRVVVNK